jgi:hypothetical protein
MVITLTASCIYLTYISVLSKLYSNMLLASLNRRRSPRDATVPSFPSDVALSPIRARRKIIRHQYNIPDRASNARSSLSSTTVNITKTTAIMVDPSPAGGGNTVTVDEPGPKPNTSSSGSRSAESLTSLDDVVCTTSCHR